MEFAKAVNEAEVNDRLLYLEYDILNMELLGFIDIESRETSTDVYD